MFESDFISLPGQVNWRVSAGLAGSVLIALLVHLLVFALRRRGARRTPFSGDNRIVDAV